MGKIIPMIPYKDIEAIASKWINSDDYDTIAYCIQDVVPATRTDIDLMGRYLRFMRKWIQVNSLEKIG